ncbi:MAG: NACHT domain-containing protein, partial [Anaerolineae bacterium]|nr:NACHT domain-containing protein [Anaerolineae bacterium]
EVIIALGLEDYPDAINIHPWDMVLQTPERKNQLLPAGTKIIDVFEQQRKSLLILGTPGSGKTTMLLELARDLILQAQQDFMYPIPVVFNLSSWANLRLSLAEWLVIELNDKYQISKKLARSWVENDALILLLDGLDEVQETHRFECIATINMFLLEHDSPLVVCSRISDYENIGGKLQTQGAILLQPLTHNQINDYFERIGDGYRTVHKTLQQDTALQELAQSPLMLSIITLVYQGVSSNSLGQHRSVEKHRQYLFNAYIKRMIERRSPIQPYTLQETLKWLIWLATNMAQRQQTIFSMADLQPDWLQNRFQLWIFRLFFGLSGGLVFGLIIGLIFGLVSESDHGLIDGVLIGLRLGLIGGLIVGLSFRRIGVRPVLQFDFDRQESIGNLIGGLIFGLVVGGILGLFFGLRLGLIGGQIVWLLFGGIGVLVSGGLFYIEYLILRILLWQYNYAPFNYTRFLDYCYNRIFLRKVGDSYIFIHRMLLDHFAQMTDIDILKLSIE